MAILTVTGPCNLYLGTYRGAPDSSGWGGGYSRLLTYPATSDIKFLGHCEQAPEFEFTEHQIPLPADLNGGGFPLDVASCLESCQITLLLNRFNDPVYDNYRSRPSSDYVPGNYRASDVGRLMMAEAFAIPLWIQFPYGTTTQTTPAAPKYAGFGMPAGYRFLATWVIGERPIQGSRTRKMLLRLQAIPVYNPVNGQWSMYDDIMSGLPIIPPVNIDGTIS